MKNRIDELVKILNYHSKRYHEQDSPLITDYEYDMLLKELIELEAKYPMYKSKDSPTQRIGAQPLKEFEKVKHIIPMESLSNAFSYEDLYSFHERIIKEGITPEYVLDKKIDGLSVSLEYKDNIFFRGSTRGDGLYGEDITNNLKTIPYIPLTLKINKIIPYLEVRGEVYMDKQVFKKLNETAAQNGDKEFANPRNAAAGSLRQLDSKITAQRNLKIFIFNLQQIKGMTFNTHTDSLHFLHEAGFITNEIIRVSSDMSEIIKGIEEIQAKRHSFPHDIDGAVIKLNNLADRVSLGSTSKAPRWSIAYKYPPEQKETVIRNIFVQVGRSGVLTPNAEFDPVIVSGSKISRATLHNMDFINSNDIRINDKVLIQKAGDVIPEVIKVLIEKRTGNEKAFVMPKKCPLCNSDVVKMDNKAAYKCTGVSCIGQIARKIEHYCSKDAMDIEGLSTATVDKFLDLRLINTIADIYELKDKKDILVKIDGYGNTSIEKLLSAIEKSKENNIDRLIFGLGIEHIGKKASSLIADNFNDMDDIMSASVEDFVSINTFGDIMSQSIVKYFKSSDVILLIDKLKRHGINMKSLNYGNTVNNTRKLVGKTFVITGSFNEYSREQLKQILISNGGNVTESVSKKTDYVIVGENPGSKLSKAESLGIKIIKIDELKLTLL
jgi:DNA ligase (NAD+)